MDAVGICLDIRIIEKASMPIISVNAAKYSKKFNISTVLFNLFCRLLFALFFALYILTEAALLAFSLCISDIMAIRSLEKSLEASELLIMYLLIAKWDPKEMRMQRAKGIITKYVLMGFCWMSSNVSTKLKRATLAIAT